MALAKGKHPNDLTIAQPVAYVPHHLAVNKTMVEIENLIHAKTFEIEFGVVKSKNTKYVFVAFFPAAAMYRLNDMTAQACNPDDLYFGI